MRRAALLLAGFSIAFAVFAAAQQSTVPAAAAAQPTRQLVEQKELLVRRLLSDSPAAKRIAASSNADAKKYMETAHEHHVKAAAALQSGELAPTDALLNEALWMIGKARQLVPDTMYRVIAWRFRYARLQDLVDALNASYDKHLTRLGKPPIALANEHDEIARLIAEGRSFRTSEQIPEAVAALERAERLLLAALNRILGSATIEYAQKFESHAEELAFEMKRNQSYGDLVPLAITELKPAPEALRLVNRYVESNHALQGQAQQQAAKKDFTAALKTIRDGTAYLQRALDAAGLVVPQHDAKVE